MKIGLSSNIQEAVGLAVLIYEPTARLAGKPTSQLIYEKLSKGTLEELQLKNPPDETGQRKH
jgi:hypothetical protein